MPLQLDILHGGNQQSETLVVFLQGWPDNYQVWDSLNWKEELKDYHLLFINYPNTNGKVDEKWGVDFPELTVLTKKTIDEVIEGKSISKKILVGHDWGCYYGYLLDEKYPKFFDQLIVMDVPGIAEVRGLKAILFVLFYQLYLASAFLVGGTIGRIMTQKLTKFFQYTPPYLNQISGAQNYPYYYMWKNIILSGLKLRPRYLKGYKPSVPLVYLYAQKKLFQFHGPKWLKLFNTDNQPCKHNQVHQMECGHWIMKKYPKFVTDLLIRRIKLKF